MRRLRQLQDETQGFTAFVPLAFHPENTKLPNLTGPSGFDMLKTLAIARIYLDNVDHIKAYWILMGMKLAQVSLSYGVDDLDGTIIEEKIYHMAGAQTPQQMAQAEMVRAIREAGREPVQRDSLYLRSKRTRETQRSRRTAGQQRRGHWPGQTVKVARRELADWERAVFECPSADLWD